MPHAARRARAPHRLPVVALAPLALAGLLACASAPPAEEGAGGAPRTVSAPGGRSSSELITRGDIEQAAVSTAYDAVQRLRPSWLRTRSSGTIQSAPQYAVVYMDGARIGGLDALRRVRAGDVQSIRYLRGPDATTRFGTGHEGGAILVETR